MSSGCKEFHCAAGCRLCAWADYFLGEGVAPWTLPVASSASPPSFPASSKPPAASSASPLVFPASSASSPSPLASLDFVGCAEHRFKADRRMRFVGMLDAKIVRDTEASHRDKLSRRSFHLDINFSLFNFDLAFGEILTKALAVANSSDFVYVGITQSPAWRWSDCWGHGSMSPHNDRFERMFVLCLASGWVAVVVEEHLILRLKEHYVRNDRKVLNSQNYRSGPVHKSDRYFVYICIQKSCGI